MLDLIRPLNPVLTTHKGQTITVGDFLGDKGMRQWKKYKHNFTVECPGLYVEFRWAPLLHLRASEKGGLQPEFKVGGWDFLQTLAEAEEDKMPDLLVLDTGAWQLHQRLETVLDQVDDASVYVMTKLRPLLARLAQRTTVVWTLPDPFKDYISHDYSRMSYFSHQTNTILEWVLNAQVSLPPPGIIKWDSFLPVAHAAVSDCVDMYVGNVSLDLLPAFNSFPSIMAWHCTERMHIGMEALSLAVQMTLNHICNPYMDGDYCCSSQDA